MALGFQVISVFNTSNESLGPQFDNLKQCQDYTDLHFNHLTPKFDNIFGVNSKIPEAT